MKKKLLLSIFTLASICPAIYCADDAPVPFRPNIYLPLQGEELARYDNALDPEYAEGLGGVIGLSISAGTSTVVFGISAVLIGIDSIVALSSALAGTVIGGSCRDPIARESRETIQYHNHVVDNMVYIHNAVVDRINPINFNVQIHIDENENKVLEIQQNDMIGNHSYHFSANLQQLKEATSGFSSQILLGSGNIGRINNVIEEVDKLDKQLVPIRNIKRAINK